MAQGIRKASPGRQIELHLPSELGWERSAMALAASVAERMGFPPDRIDDIKTAVAEATVNAIEHGNQLNAAQRVLVVLIPEGESLVIDVRDAAERPFPAERSRGARPRLEDKLAGRANTRGWGVFLIESLVDEVEFSSTSEGNVVRMIVHLEPHRRAEPASEG